MNTVTITKKDWFDILLCDSSEQMGYVIDILTDRAVESEYELIYPERFIPLNATAHLFNKIIELAEKGIEFNITTSSTIGCSYLKPKYFPEQRLLRPNFVTKEWDYTPVKMYGRNVKSVIGESF